MYINVDLKDHPDSYEGTIAPEVLYHQISKHQAEHRVLVTSFHKEQIERFDQLSKGTVAIGASQSEVTEALLNSIPLEVTLIILKLILSKCLSNLKVYDLHLQDLLNG